MPAVSTVQAGADLPAASDAAASALRPEVWITPVRFRITPTARTAAAERR